MLLRWTCSPIGRSSKAAELLPQPAVELCWLLPKACSQFRLRGNVLVLPTDQDWQQREHHWQGLTPKWRALWGWPEPGERFDTAGDFPAELGDVIPLPEHFHLVRIALSQVELLELRDHPHQRRGWQRDQGWLEERLNP
ncbi:MAG: pyridoxamine 5'-phosphate oxidase [Cyanobacteria bacterium]|nr:pyridoxamine 5'-phosphate oxidase [Cyanobacteriota bacterium]